MPLGASTSQATAPASTAAGANPTSYSRPSSRCRSRQHRPTRLRGDEGSKRHLSLGVSLGADHHHAAGDAGWVDRRDGGSQPASQGFQVSARRYSELEQACPIWGLSWGPSIPATFGNRVCSSPSRIQFRTKIPSSSGRSCLTRTSAFSQFEIASGGFGAVPGFAIPPSWWRRKTSSALCGSSPIGRRPPRSDS